MDVEGEPGAPWVPLLGSLFQGGEYSEDELSTRSAAVVAGVRASGDGILAVLQPLGAYLTTENDTPRAKATSLLAKIVREVPETVRTPGDVHHLAEFFTARLRDWPAIKGALNGCLALLERRAAVPSAPQLSEADAVAMLERFTKNVYVRSLAAAARAPALTALRLVTEAHGAAALDADVDLLEFAIASVDGEKDPRCLIQGFQTVRTVVQLYLQQPQASLAAGRLEESSDELFDVLSCYFPVSFTPPPDDPHGITRELLASELEASLVCCPAFGPALAALAAEKLSSALSTAKRDALSLLRAAANSLGPNPLKGSLPEVWGALRRELLAPAAEGLVTPELVRADAAAAAASECLRDCVAAFQAAGGRSLAVLVLDDPGTGDLLTCAAAPGGDAASARRSVACVAAGAAALGALMSAGGEAAREAAAKVLPPLLDVAEGGDARAAALAWAALAALLQALARAPDGEFCALDDTVLKRLLAACSALPAESGAAAAAATAAEESVSGSLWDRDLADTSPARVAWLKLTALEAVLRGEALAAAVPPADATAVLSTLVGAATIDNSSPGGRRVAQAAAQALCAAARGPHAELVPAAVLPPLLAAATRPDGPRSGALETLRALCPTNPETLLRDTLIGLDEAVQMGLGAAASGAGAALTLETEILATATDIMAELDDKESETAALCCSSFAQHTLDAVLLLDAATAGGAPAHLADALSAAVFVGTRQSRAEQQREIARAAAEAAAGGVTSIHAAVSCAALVALCKEMATAVTTPELLGTLAAHAAGAGAPPASRYAAIALASFLNKTDISAPIDGLLDPLIDASVAGNTEALAALAEATRGLAMRGAPAADAALRRMGSLGPEAGVSAFFGAVMRDPEASEESSTAPGLSRAAHAVVRPLWQQRTYSVAATALDAATKENPSSEAPVAAMAALLGAAPAAVLRTDARRALPWAVRCLGSLRSPGDKTLLQSLMHSFTELLDSEAGRKEAEASLARLVPALTAVAGYGPSLAVREGALRTLKLLMRQLPYAALHPYRKDVLRAAVQACDDPKRAVRAAAAAARHAWTASSE